MAKKWHLDKFSLVKISITSGRFLRGRTRKKESYETSWRKTRDARTQGGSPSLYFRLLSFSLSFFLRSDVFFLLLEKEKDFPILIIDEKFRHLFHPADELKFFIFFFFHFLNFEFLKIKTTFMNLLIHINIYDHNWNSVSRNDSKRDIYLEIF